MLPTQEATADINTGANAALAPADGFPSFGEKAGSLLGGGLEKLAGGFERAEIHTARNQHYLQQLQQQHQAQDDAFEVGKTSLQMRSDWDKRMQDYRDNPSENVLQQFNTEYDDYAKKTLDSASNPQVRSELELRTMQYKNDFMGQAHGIQVQARQSNFAAGLNTMLGQSEDAIFASKSVDELNKQKDILHQTIDSAQKTGRVQDPEIVQKLHQTVNNLDVAWAEANVSDNPKEVISALNNEKGYDKMFSGVPIHTRQTLMDKANGVIDTNDQYDKVALHQQLESDITQRMKTGQGSSLNLDRYEDTFGKGARAQAEIELNNATKLNGVIEGVKGANDTTLQKLLDAAQPKADPKSSTFALEQKYADQVQQTVYQASADKKDDAFTYFSQNPALKSLVSDVQRLNTSKKGNPTQVDTSGMSQEAELSLRSAVLNLQKMDKSLTPDEYKVMPKSEAQSFISSFNGLTQVGNSTDGAGVRDLLTQFANKYKDNLPIALNQLSKIKGGEAVTPLINPLMWHLGNPSIFRMTLDAIRKDDSTEMKRFGSDKERKSFMTDANLDPNFLSYRNSMMSANNSADSEKLVTGVQQAYTSFARDYVLNGGKIRDASQQFFSNYSWGSHNGTVFARPMNYTDQTGNQHTMSPEQVRLSDNYMKWYPSSLDSKSIDPKTILNSTRYFTSEQLGEDTKNALRENTFWSTTGDETGAYLFTKGTLNGTSKQVKDRQGNPIRVNFIDTMKPVTTQKAGFRDGEHKTSDTWLDELSNALSNVGS